MKLSHRRMDGPAEVWRVREFLRTAFAANERRARCWHVARFDYACWHVCRNVAEVGPEDVAWLLEADGELVGLVMPECAPGEAHISLAPGASGRALVGRALVGRALEEAALALAESELAAHADHETRLVVWAFSDDTLRGELLSARGYRRSGTAERQWHWTLDGPREVAAPAHGYRVRALGEGLELLERCYASGLAFHDDVRVALDNRADPAWYRNVQRAPLYRRDLDLVAEAPDGSIAGFVTAWFDDVNRSVLLEPVGVVPAHRRRGLGRALLGEALARAQHLGARHAMVGGFDERANALYGSLSPDDSDVLEAWSRAW